VSAKGDRERERLAVALAAYAKLERDREYLAAEHRKYAELTTDDLVKGALHIWHNSHCTGRGQKVNGVGPADCVYDAALVYRLTPHLIIRLGCMASPEIQALISELEAGRPAKCPMAGCTGYVELR